jgi:hypothetical protein
MFENHNCPRRPPRRGTSGSQDSLVGDGIGFVHDRARGLTRGQAAAYCGLSPAGFDDWVGRGIVPGRIPGTQRWDRRAIDLALDRASGIETNAAGTAFDEWKARRAG